MARRSSRVKVVVGLAALAILAVLFVRSVNSTRAAPFAVARAHLSGWTLVPQPPQDPLGAWLALSPPPQLARLLGRELFLRRGESLSHPVPPLVPLLLRSEFERAFAGRVPPEDIVSLARAAGLESVAWEPRCVGHRRLSEARPRGVYFLLLNQAPFDRFRQQLAERLRASGGEPRLFETDALSPVLVVAALDGEFGRWMPLRVDPEAECLAPVEVT